MSTFIHYFADRLTLRHRADPYITNIEVQNNYLSLQGIWNDYGGPSTSAAEKAMGLVTIITHLITVLFRVIRQSVWPGFAQEVQIWVFDFL